MFSTLLIANRGEIACRIIRTARAMGLRTIAVYSEADASALHVRMADEAHLLGPAPAAESYLKAGRILSIAKDRGADALHPGYGFLSENADFAAMCAETGVAFVGPPPDAIRSMGLKDHAKAIMREAGVPVVPGYDGDNQQPDFLKRKAYEIGYPVLIKAVAGGGGKGMRYVRKAVDFDEALAGAQREAAASFGLDRVMIEKFIDTPRHIEVQVFADTCGNVVHLFERDCSLQRRHQKVIEEAPAPGMTPAIREVMGQAACAAARSVGYVGAGTVEFIADGSGELHEDGFYFMEMNTRLQVEHPVTEAITGLDLVELQLRVAAGEPLGFEQADLKIDGHAVEARLYAEDAENGFLPSTGDLVACELPDHLARVDTGVEGGSEIGPHYDPMIAKVIAHGSDRTKAIERLDRALQATRIAGPKTNVTFLRRLLADDDFKAGAFDTQLIDAKLKTLTEPVAANSDDDRKAAAALVIKEDGRVPSPWGATDAFQIGPARKTCVALVRDGEPLSVELEGVIPPHDSAIVTRGTSAERTAFVLREGAQFRYTLADPASVAEEMAEGQASVVSPMNGRLIAVSVADGDRVERGQSLFAVEAMKMEHVVVAPMDGTIISVTGTVGDQVADRAVIMRIEGE